MLQVYLQFIFCLPNTFCIFFLNHYFLSYFIRPPPCLYCLLLTFVYTWHFRVRFYQYFLEYNPVLVSLAVSISFVSFPIESFVYYFYIFYLLPMRYRFCFVSLIFLFILSFTRKSPQNSSAPCPTVTSSIVFLFFLSTDL